MEGTRRNYAPGDHDPGNPSPRADPFQNQVGWHLEYKVAEEEDTNAEPEHLGGETQLPVHGKCCKPDIDSIQIGDEEAENQKWNEPQRGLTRRTARGPVG